MSDVTFVGFWPCCNDAIDWSHDGIIATASEEHVHILVGTASWKPLGATCTASISSTCPGFYVLTRTADRQSSFQTPKIMTKTKESLHGNALHFKHHGSLMMNYRQKCLRPLTVSQSAKRSQQTSQFKYHGRYLVLQGIDGVLSVYSPLTWSCPSGQQMPS
jgi:hypothetical protein